MEMKITRLDHLGILDGVIKDLQLKETLDISLGHDEQEIISHGDAIVGMILNGLGFTNRPLTLTPQFFETKAMDLLFGEGVEAEHFNRHKLGRALDRIAKFGSEQLFRMLAMKAVKEEGVDLTFAHLDTTSFALSGDYDKESDTAKIKITHGYSKDHKPGFKQVVLELMVSQDGGIPFASKAFDGNESDSVIFRERAQQVLGALDKAESDPNQCYIADSKLLSQESAKHLNSFKFITRVASIIKTERDTTIQALNNNAWQDLKDGNYKVQEFPSDLYKIDGLRLIVVYSEHARQRAEKTLPKTVAKEKERTDKDLYHLQAKRFMCKEDAFKALEAIEKKWNFLKVESKEVIEHKKYAKKGCPTKDDLPILTYQIKAHVIQDDVAIAKELDLRSCFTLATNMSDKVLTSEDVLKHYKQQDKVEKSFAFLKSHEFFASSFYLKSPERIEALITVMALALLIYTIAQRRLRKQLAVVHETLPNQINKPTDRPTLRWIFQLFEGVYCVTEIIRNKVCTKIHGLTDLRIKILRLLGPTVMAIYRIS